MIPNPPAANDKRRRGATRVREFKKILIIRFSSLGDIILTTPLLKILRQSCPAAQIDYLTKSSYFDLLRFNPNINNVLQVADDIDFKGLRSLRKTLSAANYDLIIDLHNNLRTFYLRILLRFRSKFLVYSKYSLRKFLLVKFKINLMKKLPPIYERYISTIITGPDSRTPGSASLPEIFTDTASKLHVQELLNQNNIPATGKIICIVPSSRHFTKTYPAESYAELINKYDTRKYHFVLVGKGEDKKDTELIKSMTGSNVFDFCNKLNLLELTELMKKCSLVITGDTGPMHIAEAVSVPIVMLAGSSVSEFGFYPKTAPGLPLQAIRLEEPWAEGEEAGTARNSVLEVNGLKCRPCSHIGRSYCPKGHFKCMREITPENVYLSVPAL
jgi:heptosyltransferase-2